MTDIQNAIVEINQHLKEFCKELHTAYECTELFCELHKKYGFEFEINPYSKAVGSVGSNFPYIYGQEVQWIRFHYSFFTKAVGSVGSNFPYIYGQEVQWIRFHYSFFRKDGLIEYKMYLE